MTMPKTKGINQVFSLFAIGPHDKLNVSEFRIAMKPIQKTRCKTIFMVCVFFNFVENLKIGTKYEISQSMITIVDVRYFSNDQLHFFSLPHFINNCIPLINLICLSMHLPLLLPHHFKENEFLNHQSFQSLIFF